MKKLLLALSLCCAVAAPTTTQCGIFDTAISYLQKNGMDLLTKGAKYVWDNSDKIFDAVKNPGPLFDKAKSLLFGETKKEADKEEQEITQKAKEVIATTPGLTQAEQAAILKEAQAIATRNRAELEKVATQSVEKKRAAIKQAAYEKYGKGTPIN